ncbi:hypothetical protein JCM1841_002936 [Sporobolomyces salmonicolor]
MAATGAAPTSAQQLSILLALPPSRLAYSVHSASGHHAKFLPTHIYVDKPADDSSRWTAPSPDDRKRQRKAAAALASPGAGGKGALVKSKQSEWIILELQETSLVRYVGFGKTVKPHPCNLAEFSIYGGLSPDHLSMEFLCEGSLKNDTHAERVPLPLEIGDEGRDKALLPVKYLRIECHEAASANYSISIWHLFLEGYSSPGLVSSAISSYNQHRSQTTSHLILSHLRRSGPSLLPAFHSLLSTLPAETSSSFEHPLLAQLHTALVLDGDFDRAESLLASGLAQGLFREWSAAGGKGTTTARWERLDGALAPGAPRPKGRGGHQMVRVGRKVLLFGGWDGTRDLGDLWEWDLPRGRAGEGEGEGGAEGGWRCLEAGIPDGEEAEGDAERAATARMRPSARSCHQLAVDESEGWVYSLGARRDEADAELEPWERGGDAPAAGRGAQGDSMAWRAASEGGATNGPTQGGERPMDVEGGEADEREKDDRWKSDFWRYKAVGPGRGTWERLSEDTRKDGGPSLLFDHAMVVHSATQRLFVFGGKSQPYDPDASDGGAAIASPSSAQYSGMYCYDIRARRWSHLFGDPTSTTNASFVAERLLSRAGHAMILDPGVNNPTIYVYSGQRDTRYENDLWAIRLASASSTADDEAEDDEKEEDLLWRQGAVIDLPHRAVAHSLVDPAALPASPEASPSRAPIASSSSSQPTIVQIRRLHPLSSVPSSGLPLPFGLAPVPDDPTSCHPPASFTPRLTLDPSTRTWTLLTGLMRVGAGENTTEVPLEGVWRRGKGPGGKWARIEEWASGGAGAGGARPRARFASQVVYDPLRKEHYVFGGHPQDPDDPDLRLDDFWRLKIVDPTPDEALRMAKFLVRKQRFTELCTSAPTLLALQYLQNDLSSVVDHASPAESQAFRTCMTSVLAAPPAHNIDVPLDGSGELPRLDGAEDQDEGRGSKAELYRQRHQLFEELMGFFPRCERQPDEELDQVGRLLRVYRQRGRTV